MEISDIKDAKPNQIIWDDKVKGLHVRVTAKGTKSFMIFYRTKAGQQRRPKLGEFGPMTLADARKAAKAILDQVRNGLDPKGKWDVDKEELTVAQLFKKTMEEYWDCERFRKSDRVRDANSLYKTHIEKRLAGMKLSAVTVVEVRAWHKTMSETPTAANRALEILSRMFRHAEECGLRPPGSNPCTLVRANTERKRKRFASEEEIKKLGPIFNREYSKHPHEVTYLLTLLMSGSRPRALDRAMPEQLQRIERNGEVYGVLTFNGKTTEATGEEETVIIVPKLLAMIDALPRRIGDTLFGCKMPTRLWRDIRKEIGADDLWARDFRRTFSTIGLSNGVEIGVISELLNHKSTQTTKVYAKLMDANRVNATIQIAKNIDSLVSANEVINVSPVSSSNGPSPDIVRLAASEGRIEEVPASVERSNIFD